MTVHEQFAEDLSLYALGAYQGEERRAIEKHLEECSACRQELEQLRGDMALLALSVSGPQPPASSRRRLMTAIAKEPRKKAIHTEGRRARWSWWSALGWVAAVVALALAAVLLDQNSRLREHMSELEASSSNQRRQLVEAKQLLAALSSPEAEHFTLVAGKTPPQPQGKAIYIRTSGTLLFIASNMPPIPSQKAYELWLIPTTGAPIPAGLFKPDAHGAATLVHPPLPSGVEAKAFAITIEPVTGSTAPTSQPIMVGTGS